MNKKLYKAFSFSLHVTEFSISNMDSEASPGERGFRSTFGWIVWLKAANCIWKDSTSASCFHPFWMVICPFPHQSIIPMSSEWSGTYLFPAWIWGQSSAAHNWISLAEKCIFTGAATPSATLSLTLSKSNRQRNAPWKIKGTTRALAHIYGNLCCL